MRRLALPLSVLIGLTLVWEALARADTSKVPVVPTPSEIFATMIHDRQTLLTQHIPQTLLETLLGLAIALILGVGLAALLDFSPILKRALYPLLVISQTIPIIAIAPLLILIFGFGNEPRVIVVILFCFFPIAVATIDGLTATDPDLVALLRAMGASRRQIWRKVRFPAALPALFSGFRIATTYSVIGAIFGEYVTATYGIGKYLRSGFQTGDTKQVFVAAVIASLLSILLVGFVTIIERLTLPWFFSQARHAQWDEPGIY